MKAKVKKTKAEKAKTEKVEARRWQDPRLLQRLNPPVMVASIFARAHETFAFGCVLRGGFSEKAMDLLRPIFSFDYMGAFEYENGAAPRALAGLADDHARLVTFSFEIRPEDAEVYWEVERELKRKRSEKGRQEVFKKFRPTTFYALCRSEHRDEVESFVRRVAKSDRIVRDTPLLSKIIYGYPTEVCGWLELDNGFFFFTDREMFQKTAEIFGVKVK